MLIEREDRAGAFANFGKSKREPVPKHPLHEAAANEVADGGEQHEFG